MTHHQLLRKGAGPRGPATEHSRPEGEARPRQAEERPGREGRHGEADPGRA